jgi:hypothetical protein
MALASPPASSMGGAYENSDFQLLASNENTIHVTPRITVQTTEKSSTNQTRDMQNLHGCWFPLIAGRGGSPLHSSICHNWVWSLKL